MDHARRDFFVSYTSADETWAEWISHVLEDSGYTTFVQAWDFRPGGNFVLEMQNALQSADRVIAVLSPEYLQARYPQPEWAAGFANDPEGVKRRLIPVMVRTCEPGGLLSQIVQIRIQGLDEAAAKAKLIAGVNANRSKPGQPPTFPGIPAGGASGAPRPPTGPSDRLTWKRINEPPSVMWRSDLEGRSANQFALQAVELHLCPVGDDARLQVRELTALGETLPTDGRRVGVFSAVEAIDSRTDATRAAAVANSRDTTAGIAVTRDGQRSAWQSLPHDTLGAIIDEVHLANQLASMLHMLAELQLPTADLVVPAIGIDPAQLVSTGRVEDIPRRSATGFVMNANLRPPANEAIAMTVLRRNRLEVARELVARLASELKTVGR